MTPPPGMPANPGDAETGGTSDRYAPQEPPTGKPRPWGWIVACVLLVVVAGGLAVWALSLNSDLSHQKDQTALAQQNADAASNQVDDITQAVNDASDEISQAGQGAADNAQAALDGLKGKLAALKEKLQAAAGANTGDGSDAAAATTATETQAP